MWWRWRLFWLLSSLWNATLRKGVHVTFLTSWSSVSRLVYSFYWKACTASSYPHAHPILFLKLKPLALSPCRFDIFDTLTIMYFCHYEFSGRITKKSYGGLRKIWKFPHIFTNNGHFRLWGHIYFVERYYNARKIRIQIYC